jgi:hypothetical protein
MDRGRGKADRVAADPGAVGLAGVVLDARLVLGNEEVIGGKAGIPGLVALELFAGNRRVKGTHPPMEIGI